MRLSNQLFHQLDMVVEERGLPSRSHWIAELIRKELAEHGTAMQPDEMLSGTVTIVYGGSTARVRHQLASTLSGFLKEVISSQHVFLQDEKSLEVLIVQGPVKRLHDLSDAVRKVRGVQQLRLTTTKALLPPLHEQARTSRGGPAQYKTMPTADHAGATLSIDGDTQQ